jgi:hypothetical protein
LLDAEEADEWLEVELLLESGSTCVLPAVNVCVAVSDPPEPAGVARAVNVDGVGMVFPPVY